MSKPLVLFTLTYLVYGGRWKGISEKEKHQFRDKLVDIADSLKMDIADTMNTFNRYHTWDHYSAFIESIWNVTKLNELRDGLSGLRDYDHSNFPLNEEIRGIVQKYGTEITGESEDLLQDYTYYLKHHKLRRGKIGNRE